MGPFLVRRQPKCFWQLVTHLPGRLHWTKIWKNEVSELVFSQTINKSTQLSIIYVQILNLLHNCLRGKNIFPLQKVCTLLQYFSIFMQLSTVVPGRNNLINHAAEIAFKWKWVLKWTLFNPKFPNWILIQQINILLPCRDLYINKYTKWQSEM